MPVFAQIPPPPFQGIPLGPLDLRMYGLVIAVGALLGLRLTMTRYERFGGDPDLAEKAGLIALAGGFLGARIGYVIPRFLGDGGFVERPLDILAIWQGGLAFFGGLIGGALAVIVYLHLKGVRLWPFADAIAPGLPLAQAFGRWGNYFNQELFGRPTDLPWALRVDPIPASTAARFPGATTFHPTFLYESLWNLALVGVILAVDRAGWLRRRGSLFFIYLIGYGIGRGWVEALRVDTAERYPAVWGLTEWGLSRNNWIAIATALVGVVGLILWERRGAGELIARGPASDPEFGDAEGEALDALDAADADHADDADDETDETDEGHGR
ncbi:MAG: prolipoprotein diacylglyceryl transferase [Nitriliruptoraceae bacterium]|nr:prolipoprotein diacylglyceryl transferase [Nitriliruptoraceae bacterium]